MLICNFASERSTIFTVFVVGLLTFLTIQKANCKHFPFEDSDQLKSSGKQSSEDGFRKGSEIPTDNDEPGGSDKSVLDILTTDDKDELLEKTQHTAAVTSGQQVQREDVDPEKVREEEIEKESEHSQEGIGEILWSFLGLEEKEKDEKEGSKDSDSDGIPDDQDDDDDNDGVPDYLDDDDDGDGILDIFEGAYSSDGLESLFYDFQANEFVYHSVDEENSIKTDVAAEEPSIPEEKSSSRADVEKGDDGIAGGVEGNGGDNKNDVIPDDSSNVEKQKNSAHGFMKSEEKRKLKKRETKDEEPVDSLTDDEDSMPVRDTDNDGIPDYLDVDDDGDGILDFLEEEFESDFTSYSEKTLVSFDDNLQSESSEEETEQVNEKSTEDAQKNDGQVILDDSKDSDNDGIPDYLDEDDDGDGILDFLEEEFTGELPSYDELPENIVIEESDAEVDEDDEKKEVESAKTNKAEQENEEAVKLEHHDIHETELKDSDNDGIPDDKDNDDDNDGIPDYLDEDDDGDGILDFMEKAEDGGANEEIDYLEQYYGGVSEDFSEPTEEEEEKAVSEAIPEEFSKEEIESETKESNAGDTAETEESEDERKEEQEEEEKEERGEIVEETDKSELKDSDNDGIPDDKDDDDDNDGIPDYLDEDDDGDGILDFFEDDSTKMEHLFFDFQEYEKENDELLMMTSDEVEDEEQKAQDEQEHLQASEAEEVPEDKPTMDQESDEIDEDSSKIDSDNDGTPDDQDDDDDNDGIPDYLDEDDDGDGILDFLEDDHQPEPMSDEQTVEVISTEASDDIKDEDEAKDDSKDSDNDGIPDDIDDDDDNDGIPDYLDEDDDGDGILDFLEEEFTGELPSYDLFSDNTITEEYDFEVVSEDTAEAETTEVERSEIKEEIEVVEEEVVQIEHQEDLKTELKDSDNDGIPDIEDDDDDNDGVPDYLDEDDDGDGILDFLEEEFTEKFSIFDEPSEDMVTEEYDSNYGSEDDGETEAESIESSQIKEDEVEKVKDVEEDEEDEEVTTKDDENQEKESKDSDIDGIPDYLDEDDDGDGILDLLEEEFTERVPGFEAEDALESIEEEDDKLVSEEEEAKSSEEEVVESETEESEREENPESTEDADRVESDETPDTQLKDSDNDGIPDVEDDDDDNDGIPDYLDEDDDGDGILDFLEEEFAVDLSKFSEDVHLDELTFDDYEVTEGEVQLEETKEEPIVIKEDIEDLESSIPDEAAKETPDESTEEEELKDSDNDGIPDNLDDDDDNDGLPDYLDDDDDDVGGDAIMNLIEEEFKEPVEATHEVLEQQQIVEDVEVSTDADDLKGDDGEDQSADESSAVDVSQTDESDSSVDEESERLPEAEDEPTSDRDSDLDGIPDLVDDDDDNDGVREYLDVDDDGDGILDFLEDDYQSVGVKEQQSVEEGVEEEVAKESQPTGEESPALDDDSDKQEPLEATEESVENAREEIVEEAREEDSDDVKDSDLDGIPDHLDDDDDNDGIPDYLDDDDDKDGILDFLEDDYYAYAADVAAITLEDQKEEAEMKTEREAEQEVPGVEKTEATFADEENKMADVVVEDHDEDKVDEQSVDSDLDGTPDRLDEDDDNDGIVDYLDEDDDGDGILDFLEEEEGGYVDEGAFAFGDDVKELVAPEEEEEEEEKKRKEEEDQEVDEGSVEGQPEDKRSKERVEKPEVKKTPDKVKDEFSFSRIAEYFFQTVSSKEETRGGSEDVEKIPDRRHVSREFHSVPPSQSFTAEERQRFLSRDDPPEGLNIDLTTDSDGDGIPDYRDEDDDDDGVPDHYDPEFKLPPLVKRHLPDESRVAANATAEENKILLSELIQLLSSSPDEDLDPALEGIDSEQTCQLTGILKNIEKSVPKSRCELRDGRHGRSRASKSDRGGRAENADMWSAVKLLVWGSSADEERIK